MSLVLGRKDFDVQTYIQYVPVCVIYKELQEGVPYQVPGTGTGTLVSSSTKIEKCCCLKSEVNKFDSNHTYLPV